MSIEEIKQNLNKLIDDKFAELKAEILAELRRELQELQELLECKEKFL